MKKVLIYGVPGVGKSTLAKALAQKLGYEYVELNRIRPHAQSKFSKNQVPFLYEYATEAWKKFGPLNYETARQGLLAIREAFQPFIDQEITNIPSDIVAEAVFIEPQGPSTILVVDPDAHSHYERFFTPRRHTDVKEVQFVAARYIQDYLTVEAKENNIPVVVNNGNAEDVLSELLLVGAKYVH